MLNDRTGRNLGAQPGQVLHQVFQNAYLETRHVVIVDEQIGAGGARLARTGLVRHQGLRVSTRHCLGRYLERSLDGGRGAPPADPTR